MATPDCDGCGRPIEASRVVFSTEATAADGVDVLVAKRWVVCPSCAQGVFDAIGEPSPWSDEDFKTMVLPGDDDAAAQLGGLPPRARLG